MDFQFYKNLESTSEFEDLSKRKWYTPLPDDWCIAISDVRNSTELIQQGRYRDVNLIGASIIAALSNTLPDLELPYTFSGDGALIAFPATFRNEAEQVLTGCRKLANSYQLNLAAGVIPASLLYKAGYSLLVAKFKPSNYISQASFMGNGIREGEKMIKKESAPINDSEPSMKVDLSGLECRWEPFPADGLAISLIVAATDESLNGQFNTYQAILKSINEIFEDPSESLPIKEKNMVLSFRLSSLWAETKLKCRDSLIQRIIYIFKLMVLQLTGKLFMKFNISTGETHWGDYKPDFIKNSDYRKFNQSLRMIITGNRVMKKRLVEVLEKLYRQKKIIYGLHETASTVSTCYIKEYQNNHIHFIDGAEGGYTKASIDFKKRFKQYMNRNDKFVKSDLYKPETD